MPFLAAMIFMVRWVFLSNRRWIVVFGFWEVGFGIFHLLKELGASRFIYDITGQFVALEWTVPKSSRNPLSDISPMKRTGSKQTHDFNKKRFFHRDRYLCDQIDRRVATGGSCSRFGTN